MIQIEESLQLISLPNLDLIGGKVIVLKSPSSSEIIPTTLEKNPSSEGLKSILPGNVYTAICCIVKSERYMNAGKG